MRVYGCSTLAGTSVYFVHAPPVSPTTQSIVYIKCTGIRASHGRYSTQPTSVLYEGNSQFPTSCTLAMSTARCSVFSEGKITLPIKLPTGRTAYRTPLGCSNPNPQPLPHSIYRSTCGFAKKTAELFPWCGACRGMDSLFYSPMMRLVCVLHFLRKATRRTTTPET